jgi:rhamnose transport system substrate-binding protein
MLGKKAGLVGVVGLALIAGLAVALSAAAGTARKQAGYKIFLLPKTTTIPVFTQNGIGAKTAAKELGDTLTYNGPTDVSGPKQVPFIDAAARQGYNAIVISTPDPNAVAPALKRAAAKGVKVVAFDGDTAPDSRTIFVAPTSNSLVGLAQVEAIGKQIGYKGDIAILSANATSPNQNTWIKFMKIALKKPKYRNIKLVKIAYGNDDDQKSFTEAQGLLQSYPNLKVIVSPTTVGIAAASRYVSASSYKGKVAITGLGLPNQMRQYVKDGTVKKFALWDPADIGYLAAYAGAALKSGQITGAQGEKFKAGKLGEYTVGADGEIVLGPPTEFTAANIDQFDF